MVGVGIYSILSNDTDVAALVGTKIYPIQVKEGDTSPYISYQVISNVPSNTKQTVSLIDRYRVQVSCFATTYPDVLNLAKKVRDALDNLGVNNYYTGEYKIKISSVDFDGEISMYIDSANIFEIAQDYEITAYITDGIFKSTWKTDNTGTSGDTQIALPLESGGTYNFIINWGDDNEDTITAWDQAETTHTYSSAGTYTVRISGTIDGWRFNAGGDKLKILTIDAWGDFLLGNNNAYFSGCSNLVINAIDELDVSSVTDFTSIFFGCTSLTTLGVGSWDVSNVTTFKHAFSGCTAFTTLDVSSWDVSSVTDFTSIFSGCTSLTTLDVSSWDVSSVTTFKYAFLNCRVLTALDVGSWDVSSVTDFFGAFSSCRVFTTLDVSSWNVSSVTTFQSTFSSCKALTTLDVSSWDVSSVTTFQSTFPECEALTTLDVSSWDVSSVTTFKYAFLICTVLTTLDVSGWDVSSVTDFTSTFEDCLALTTLDADEWDITSVTDMPEMFDGVTLTVATYDAILIAWEAQSVQNSVTFDGGNSKYTAGGAAATARAALIADHSWTITDGGTV